jgi:hypothetical protein
VTAGGAEADTPLVSVIIPVHNGEPFVADAVDSVLDQTLRDIEVVVVDDGSTDGTPDVLADRAARDPRVVVRRQEQRGRSAARNAGLALSRAPLVALLDADDCSLPDRLALQHAFLVAHPNVGAVGGAVRFVDRDGAAFADVHYPVTDAEIRAALAVTCPIVHSTAMVRRSVFDEIGGYREAFTAAQDFDVWLRIADRAQLANLPDIVGLYRVHAGQTTAQMLEMQVVCAAAARLSAASRASGRTDPFDNGIPITRERVLAAGARPDDLADAHVRSCVWFAKTVVRSGDRVEGHRLFAEAHAIARAARSRSLAALIERERAELEAQQGHPVAARWHRVRGRVRLGR